MNTLVELGRRRTILLSISVLLITMFTIYFYQSSQEETDVKKLSQQIIRFFLTMVLLYYVYMGKKWARILSIILFSLGILGALVGLFMKGVPLEGKVPFLVMIFIYSMAVYHVALSKSYQAFFDFQNGHRKG